MKKRIVLLALAVMAVSLAFVASAQAWTSVGACQLHIVDLDHPGNDRMQAGGYINQCPSGGIGYDGAITVCIQVKTPTGGWVDKSGTCFNRGRQTMDSTGNYMSALSSGGYVAATSGHSYRSEDTGHIWHNGSEWTASYQQSPGWTAP